ncbi:hypothetical protein ABLA37_22550 [Vibrio parahaemolyticus]
MNDVRLNQLFAIVLHSAALYACWVGAHGNAIVENLYSAFVVFISIMGCVGVVKTPERDWYAMLMLRSTLLHYIARLLIGVQILLCMAFGWFWIGGFLLFSTLAVMGQGIKMRRAFNEAA